LQLNRHLLDSASDTREPGLWASDRIEVCDRKLASFSYQGLFDLLFSTSTFEYIAVVALVFRGMRRGRAG
jgi:hypothetical protein